MQQRKQLPPILFSFSAKTIYVILVLAGVLTACNQNQDKKLPENQTDQKQLRENLINANKQAVKAESQQIDEYIRRHQWQMQKTGSGLRYTVYQEGTGEKARVGKIAVLKYSVSLIDGTQIYSSEEKGVKSFEIGHGGVEGGLEEGILLLRVGDRAKFILPSHLGFGLLGDQDKIPPKSTLIYDIELLALR